RLKTAKDETQDYHLQRAYKMELYGFIISLALPIIIPIFFIVLLVPIFAGSYADPYAVIGAIMLLVLAIIVIALIPIILQIVAGIALADWAEALSMQQPANYPLRKISDGVKNIKLGRILSVIPMVNFLGPFVVIYGFWTGGKAIMNVYGGSASTPQMTSQYGQTQGEYDTPSMPSHVTIAPRSSDICQYCGTPKANPDAQFCSVCGKEIR
ncbi:MAG: zinc ribbon domain-containing protein, partial [Promethearchaeota archaeon]